MKNVFNSKQLIALIIHIVWMLIMSLSFVSQVDAQTGDSADEFFETEILVVRYNGDIVAIGGNNPLSKDISSIFIPESVFNREDLTILLGDYGWEMYSRTRMLNKVVSLGDKFTISDGNTLTIDLETVKIISD